MTIKAATGQLAAVREFIAKRAEEFGFNEKQISDIRLAVDEACTNIIKHAYDYDESKKVEIKTGYRNDRLWVSLSDTGEAFKPENYSKPDLRKQMKSRKRGGVGVYLIKKLMDEVEYSQEADVNVIRMYKNRS